MSFFITFEGIEGSGKSTQLRLLQDHLLRLGHQVVATREPGGCAISDCIRSLLLAPDSGAIIPRAELLLYSAARAQHVAEIIRPALRQGKIVLCDRFSDATIVYQGVGRGLDGNQLAAINRFASDGLSPDMTLLLDYPIEAGLLRARTRNQEGGLEAESRFEQESMAFHRRIRKGYLDLFAEEDRFHVIDARGNRESVAERIAIAVDQFLARRRSA